MPLSACSSAAGLLVTAAVAMLVLAPANYYVADFMTPVPELVPVTPPPAPPPPPAPLDPHPEGSWYTVDLVYFPTLDLIFTFALLILYLLIYVCEWIQRKILERRIVKMNQYLAASVERLRAWDVQQEQLETTLRMVQNATAEYNLLLLLLLRQHRCLAHKGPPSNCFFDKDFDAELNFLMTPA